MCPSLLKRISFYCSIVFASSIIFTVRAVRQKLYRNDPHKITAAMRCVAFQHGTVHGTVSPVRTNFSLFLGSDCRRRHTVHRITYFRAERLRLFHCRPSTFWLPLSKTVLIVEVAVKKNKWEYSEYSQSVRKTSCAFFCFDLT